MILTFCPIGGLTWRPQDLLDEEVCLDGHRKILGLAKGKNPYITALCPAYPEVKQFWLDQVQNYCSASRKSHPPAA